tara:strand:+ start:828 stop:1022 length:195 start_codon:yes stop_codon:yes gene_type:complete
VHSDIKLTGSNIYKNREIKKEILIMLEPKKPVCLEGKAHYWIVATRKETSKGAVCNYCNQISPK